ncbi:hypothetical protein FO519_000943 [Halicephalobus sp. NKZ332]|nr:hypothetical protein FO519_000943 [Halicephalobus sp. NKZ332]
MEDGTDMEILDDSNNEENNDSDDAEYEIVDVDDIGSSNSSISSGSYGSKSISLVDIIGGEIVTTSTSIRESDCPPSYVGEVLKTVYKLNTQLGTYVSDHITFSSRTAGLLMEFDRLVSELVKRRDAAPDLKNYCIGKYLQVLGDITAARIGVRNLSASERSNYQHCSIVCYLASLKYLQDSDYGDDKVRACILLSICEMKVTIDYIQDVYGSLPLMRDDSFEFLPLITRSIERGTPPYERQMDFLSGFNFDEYINYSPGRLDFETEFVARLPIILNLVEEKLFFKQLLYIIGYGRITDYSFFDRIFPLLRDLKEDSYMIRGLDAYLILITFAIQQCQVINYRFGYEFVFKNQTGGKFVLEKPLDNKQFSENPYMYFIPPMKRHPNPSFISELFWKALVIIGREDSLEKRNSLINEVFGNEDALREFCSLIRDHSKVENSDLFYILEKFYLLNCLKLNEQLPSDIIDEKLHSYRSFLQGDIQRSEGHNIFRIEPGSNLSQIYPNHDFSVVFPEVIYLFDKEKMKRELVAVDRVFNPNLIQPAEEVFDSKSIPEIEEVERVPVEQRQSESSEEEDIEDEFLSDEPREDVDDVSDGTSTESESDDETNTEPQSKVDYVMEMSKLMEESLKITQGERYQSTELSWPEIIQRGRNANQKCSYSLSANYSNELKKMKDEYAEILFRKENRIPLFPSTPKPTVRDPKNDIFAGVKENWAATAFDLQQKLADTLRRISNVTNPINSTPTPLPPPSQPPMSRIMSLIGRIIHRLIEFRIPNDQQLLLITNIHNNFHCIESGEMTLEVLEHIRLLDQLVVHILNELGLVDTKTVATFYLLTNANMTMTTFLSTFAKSLVFGRFGNLSNTASGPRQMNASNEAFKVAFQHWRGINDDTPEQVRAQVIAPSLTPQQIATYKPTHTAHETTPDDILSSPHNRNHSDQESDLPDILDL